MAAPNNAAAASSYKIHREGVYKSNLYVRLIGDAVLEYYNSPSTSPLSLWRNNRGGFCAKMPQAKLALSGMPGLL